MAKNKQAFNDIGAIWKMKKNGRVYLSMTIKIDGKEKRFVAFKNRKKKMTHPDYRIYASEPQPKKDKEPEPKEPLDKNDIEEEEFPFE